MKDISIIEAVEKNAYECMGWMKNEIKEVIENLMRQNEENCKYNTTNYDRGYTDGVHDGLLDVLNAFDIQTEEEYYNN